MPIFNLLPSWVNHLIPLLLPLPCPSIMRRLLVPAEVVVPHEEEACAGLHWQDAGGLCPLLGFHGR
jgi:hypothetical protein